uniref:Uncharacterized protein n=1 Tax=Timema tahoe TaxID=61484 RepID=A0A7R9P186_9NEOP|nr:unnamed protein product [Timema tahoe]
MAAKQAKFSWRTKGERRWMIASRYSNILEAKSSQTNLLTNGDDNTRLIVAERPDDVVIAETCRHPVRLATI